MTHRRSRNYSLSVVVAFFAILIVSVAFVAQAQMTASGQQSVQQAVLSARQDSARSHALHHPALPGANNAEPTPAIRRQSDRLAAGPMASDTPILILAATYSSGGEGALSVAVADVNNDGKPDLIVANCGKTLDTCLSGVVGVLLGNGDGTFKPPVTYGSGGAIAQSVAVGDVNNDGKPDLVVANGCDSQGCAHAVIGVLLGNGDGSFQPALTYSSGGYYSDSVAVADVNNDSKPDLLVSNFCSDSSCANGTVAVLLGNGDGSFGTALTYNSGGIQTTSIAVRDVNNDGKPDLLITNECVSKSSCDGSVGVLLGNGDGTFQPATTRGSGGSAAESIAVADVNNDGKPDLLVANQQGSSPNYSQVLAVLLGNGDGTFQPTVSYSFGGSGAQSGAVGDVNGDGKPDLVLAGGSAVGVLLGNGDGTFQPAETYSSGGYPAYSVAVADINGDGRPDVLVTNYCTSIDPCGGGLVGVLLNNTGPHISTTTALVSSANPSDIRQIVTYTAVVTSQSGEPVTGTVAFQDGGSAVATFTVAGNQAAYSTQYKTVGVHAITAAYSGDLHNSNSISATLTEYIRGASHTVVITSGTPSFVGQPVTFTSTVTSAYGAIPNGELMTFYDGTTAIGTGTTAGGVATFTTSSLTVKTHSIKATYAGDTTFKPSSGMVTQVVVKDQTNTTLSSSLNPSIYGQPVTLTATVTPTGPYPLTGAVTFRDGTLAIGTATPRGGVATVTKPRLAVGTHSITAAYGGDASNGKSGSSAIKQTVSQASISMVLTSTPNPSAFGASVKFTARLTSNGGLPSGQPVTFSYNGGTQGTANVSSTGVATFSTITLPRGSDVVTAAYAGSAGYSSASATVTQVVH
ncbi:MAG: FG-GAP-like repeat-containing protein [Acidobacteriia bacterium]|nr:FG-GAP-like repeat-containing protein [Terriglobia bacterium]